MASPQLQDGFTRLANEIVEAMARLVLNSQESRCLWVIFRRTYGFQKREAQIALSQFAEATGMATSHVCNALVALQRRHIITIQSSGHFRSYAFQKDHTAWDFEGPQGRKNAGRPIMTVSPESYPNEKVTQMSNYPNGQEKVTHMSKNNYPNGEIQKKERKGGSRDLSSLEEIDSVDYPGDASSFVPKEQLSAEKPKEPRATKPKTPPNPLTNVVMNRIQTEYGKPILHWATHGAEVKKMLAAGYTEEQIFGCWKAMRDEKKRWIRLSWVAEDIGDYVANGEKRGQKGQGKNGFRPGSSETRDLPPIDGDEEELNRYYAASKAVAERQKEYRRKKAEAAAAANAGS